MKTSTFQNGAIWFGAAVSLAEILTGMALAPLGFGKGLAAILIGHIIGCVLLYLAGLIGGKTEKSAMETVKMSFGSKGSMLFIVLNIIQLVGWTAIMIYDGAIAANGIFDLGHEIWAIAIGALILVWLIAGNRLFEKINTVAMFALFLLTIVLSFVIFRGNSGGILNGEAISFGAAVELSVAMPLSWLPLISDYTRDAKYPRRATAVSAIVYFAVSSWMYIIGMGATLFNENADLVQIMQKAGIGVAGLLIIVFSTVTTTFLDAYSAGISSESLSKKLSGKWIAVSATVVGVLGAIFLPLYNITDFLYFIGSVFAPMIAIMIADFFIIKSDVSDRKFCAKNIIIWIFGFIVYRILMRFDIIIGSTLPDILITIAACIIFKKKL